MSVETSWRTLRSSRRRHERRSRYIAIHCGCCPVSPGDLSTGDLGRMQLLDSRVSGYTSLLPHLALCDDVRILLLELGIAGAARDRSALAAVGTRTPKGVTMTAVAQVRRPEIVTRSIQVVKLGEDTRALELGALPDVPGSSPATEAFPAPQAASASSPSTFKCNVDKDKQKLGIRVEYVREKCIVVALTEGAIPSWNAANADKAIRRGDRIKEVNGETAKGIEIAEKLAKSSGQVELVVERPIAIQIPLQAGNPMGIKVAELLDGFGLEVTEVKPEGQVPSFNKENQLKVKESDRIAAVNGKEASSTELFEMISSADCKELLVYAYS
eukprot:s436_g26.t1